MNSFVLFHAGQSNPLFRLGLDHHLSTATLWPALAVICLLLGHAAYTDLAGGRIIKNGTTGALFCVAVVLLPFLYQHPEKHLIWVGVALAFLAFLYLFGAVAEGDVKLYAGLAVLLGKAMVALFFISWMLIIIYSIPIIVVTWKERRRRKQQASGDAVIDKFGQRLGAGPGGPGIALAFPITVWAIGASSLQTLALIGIEAAAVAWFYLDHWIEGKVEQKQSATSTQAAEGGQGEAVSEQASEEIDSERDK